MFPAPWAGSDADARGLAVRRGPAVLPGADNLERVPHSQVKFGVGPAIHNLPLLTAYPSGVPHSVCVHRSPCAPSLARMRYGTLPALPTARPPAAAGTPRPRHRSAGQHRPRAGAPERNAPPSCWLQRPGRADRAGPHRPDRFLHRGRRTTRLRVATPPAPDGARSPPGCPTPIPLALAEVFPAASRVRPLGGLPDRADPDRHRLRQRHHRRADRAPRSRLLPGGPGRPDRTVRRLRGHRGSVQPGRRGRAREVDEQLRHLVETGDGGFATLPATRCRAADAAGRLARARALPALLRDHPAGRPPGHRRRPELRPDHGRLVDTYLRAEVLDRRITRP